jgi:hypothetical protein
MALFAVKYVPVHLYRLLLELMRRGGRCLRLFMAIREISNGAYKERQPQRRPACWEWKQKTHKGNYADRQGEYENAMAGTVEDKES